MVTIEQIGEAALQRDSLAVRALVQEFLRLNTVLATVPMPHTVNVELLVVSAAIIELLSIRSGQNPPDWTQTIGPAEKPIFLIKSASNMRRLRDLCRDAAPYPLRKRRLYAPPDYLAFV
jgi:hypothetical protein